MADDFPHDVVGTKFAEGEVGALQDEIYKRMSIRVRIEELYEGNNRVLVFHIPPRPVGMPLQYEGVALMRVGESLRVMSNDEMYNILQEREPDFSKTFCDGISISDLDANAIKKMKEAYAHKKNNPTFTALSDNQALSDLHLISGTKITYAALILLGKKEIIHDKLPQSCVIWEYRNDENQIHHDSRTLIEGPLFYAIDELWNIINQPALNKKHPVQSGAYIFDLFDFNEAVIRESILNSVSHRNYTLTSEVVVKQYPESIQISNPGGFPRGVTKENILRVNSTPRNRLITEVLEKTGLVERSGQGIDKIYSITLSEGKIAPSFSASDNHQVILELKSKIQDEYFHIFINNYKNRSDAKRLGVYEIIALADIRNGRTQNIDIEILNKLSNIGLIQKLSGSGKYALSQDYHDLFKSDAKIGERYIVKEVENIVEAIQQGNNKVGALEENLSNKLNRSQIKYLLGKLLEDNVIKTIGKGRGTKYSLEKRFENAKGEELKSKVIDFLKMKYKELL